MNYMSTDYENINYLKHLMRNIKEPNSKLLKKIYNKAKNKTSYKITDKYLTRKQIRSTRTESIQAALILRKKLGLDVIKKPKKIINLTHNVINLT